MLERQYLPKKNLPLYQQCAMELRSQIMEGKWEEGDLLPSEVELSAIFNVSRITIRQALKLLEEEGLIIKLQGKGTFVQKKKTIEQDLFGIHDFAQKASLKGYKPDFVIENIQIFEATKYITKVLKLEDEKNIYKIERIKLEDNKPVMFERIFLPYKYVPDLSLEELSKKWLSKILKELNLPITKVKYTIDPLIIDNYEAIKLMVPPRSLGLLVDRLSWSNDKPIMFTRSVVRTDLVKYTYEIER